MDVISFNKIVSSENAARKYVLGFCWKNHQRYCPRCGGRKLYKVAGGKRRCARCLYTFHDFSQRFINGCAFSFQQWLWFLKLFALNVSSGEIATQLKVSYATVLKANDLVRRAILAQSVDASACYALGVWPGPGRKRVESALPDSPVFGVLSLNGFILCDVLSELTPEDLLRFKLNFYLKTASLGHVVYTAPYRQYQLLACCGPSLWPTRYITHSDMGVPADGMDFWMYVKQRLRKLRGVIPAQFPLHLKEWELRYNHRNEALLPVLVAAVAGFVPNPDQNRASRREFPPAEERREASG